MAQYQHKGRSRGTGQGRYAQLHGSGSGGLMAATMILGALLVVSVALTVFAWVGRGETVTKLNELQKKYDAKLTGDVQEGRKEFFDNVQSQTGDADGCDRCAQLRRERNGYTAELRKAYTIMTAKQRDELQYNYDIVAKNMSLKYVRDPANINVDRLQISFTVKNQCTEARGNMHGLFKLYKDKKEVWQRKFKVDTLLPGKTTDVRIMGPGNIDWDGWFCNIYPSVPTGPDGLPQR
jgi:hypothetical protein